MKELFAKLEYEVPAPENQFPYIIVGYWSPGGYWKVFNGMFSDPCGKGILEMISSAQNRGWTNIRVIKLPELRKGGANGN